MASFSSMFYNEWKLKKYFYRQFTYMYFIYLAMSKSPKQIVLWRAFLACFAMSSNKQIIFIVSLHIFCLSYKVKKPKTNCTKELKQAMFSSFPMEYFVTSAMFSSFPIEYSVTSALFCYHFFLFALHESCFRKLSFLC